ncbi:potassium channel family protein [Halodesulfovibrio marinisediminis]|uniref:Trk system potassium uptake protein TrkA n=1 Tax=Halodesulfovibrio marinisediminis DSM 17456 TaxID=1121457 RepID=A0A1N6IDE8_9BACT|nr:TrkA family potassium uptake protein [Halodesulfovibrio marinisediminis]SIO30066.1 trk system potassium uptake protein TrkA [Halodesulfovibrio marinisediminis DSM 17456]
MKKKEVGIIGLGKFGGALAQCLSELGHTVIGVDSSASATKKTDEFLSQTYEADATDDNVLKQLRFMDLDEVVVSVGKSMEKSILIVLNLQEIGVKKMAVKAISHEHAVVLERLGVDTVIQPERDAASQYAHRIANPGMLDLLPLGGNILLQELIVDKWTGKTLIDLELTSFGVMVVAIKKNGDTDYSFVPRADRILEKGDILVAIGKESDLLDLES